MSDITLPAAYSMRQERNPNGESICIRDWYVTITDDHIRAITKRQAELAREDGRHNEDHLNEAIEETCQMQADEIAALRAQVQNMAASPEADRLRAELDRQGKSHHEARERFKAEIQKVRDDLKAMKERAKTAEEEVTAKGRLADEMAALVESENAEFGGRLDDQLKRIRELECMANSAIIGQKYADREWYRAVGLLRGCRDWIGHEANGMRSQSAIVQCRDDIDGLLAEIDKGEEERQ